MRCASRLLVALVVTMGLMSGTASAQTDFRMDRLFASPNQATNSDFAFWGNHAFSGYYTGDAGFPAGTGPRGGFRIFDVSNPGNPRLIRDFKCDGLQNDPFVWDTDDNGVADLMLLAVDRTMERPFCGADRSMQPGPTGNPVAFHGDPTGWEGVRVFTMSDNPSRSPRSTPTAGHTRSPGGPGTSTRAS